MIPRLAVINTGSSDWCSYVLRGEKFTNNQYSHFLWIFPVNLIKCTFIRNDLIQSCLLWNAFVLCKNKNMKCKYIFTRCQFRDWRSRDTGLNVYILCTSINMILFIFYQNKINLVIVHFQIKEFYCNDKNTVWCDL